MINKNFWIDHFTSSPPDILRTFLELTTIDCNDILKSLGKNIYEATIFESAENKVFGFEKFVIKFYRPGRWSLEALQDEIQFLEDLREAGVPFVRSLSKVETWKGIHYIVFEKISKAFTEAPQILSEQDVGKLVKVIAQFHEVGSKRSANNRPIFNPEETCLGCFEVIKKAGFINKNLQITYEKLISELIICFNNFKDLPIQRIHGDTYSGNTIWNSDGPIFIDLDDFQMAPVALDLRLLSSGWRLDTLPESMNRLECREIQQDLILNIYREYRSFPKSWESVFPLLSAYRDIVFDAWFSARWLEPGFALNYPDENIQDFNYWKNSLANLQNNLDNFSSTKF